MFTGNHSPRRVIRRPEQGILNDGREHSLRIERLPGRSVFVSLFILCFLPMPKHFRFLLWLNWIFSCLFLPVFFHQIFFSSGGRGGQEGDNASRWPACEPGANLPRGYSCGSRAEIQQGQHPLPGMYMEPDGQRSVCISVTQHMQPKVFIDTWESSNGHHESEMLTLTLRWKLVRYGFDLMLIQKCFLTVDNRPNLTSYTVGLKRG